MKKFKRGDIVQCVGYIGGAPEGFAAKTKEFYKIDDTPHPFYGLIGVVYDDRYPETTKVWFPAEYMDIANRKEIEMPGKIGAFSDSELVKIGESVVRYPYDKIALVRQEFDTGVIQNMNKMLGTNYSTMEEFLDANRKGGMGDDDK